MMLTGGLRLKIRGGGKQRTSQVLTVLLYVTAGVDSTAMPRFRPERFAVPDYPTEDARETTNAAAMRRTIESRLLEKDQYHSRMVIAGDMLVFRQSIPHYGTRNPSPQSPRVVLFSIYTPYTDPHQDEYQSQHTRRGRGRGGPGRQWHACRRRG